MQKTVKGCGQKTVQNIERIPYEALNEQLETTFRSKPIDISIKRRKFYEIMKRILDIAVSAIALIVLAPFLVIISVLIKIDSKGPVIFKQLRVEKSGRLFIMYKFRSMCVNADKMQSQLLHINEKDGPIFKCVNDPRITRIGRFIRKYSIDELPQFLNVLKGDMSLVGPRPPLPGEVKKYTPYQMQRLNVLPGLTCYWQINGRSLLSFGELIEYDLAYIRDRSLWVDFKILIATIPVVLFGRGAC